MSGSIFLQTTTIGVPETGGVARVPISRLGDTSLPVTVEYAVSGVSASAGEDFVETTSSITIAAGADGAVIEVPVLDDDLFEDTETFQVSLIRVDSGSLLAPRTAIVSILDDENPLVEPAAPPLIAAYEVAEEPLLTGLDRPISFEFTENGERLYVAEKGGVIKVFDTATGEFLSTFVDLSDVVNDAGDRGLVDIALSPNFPQDPSIYAFYVVDPPEVAGQTGPAGPDGIGNRFAYVVRFEADAANDFLTAVPDSETILLGAAGQSLDDISGGGALDFTAAEFADETSSAVDPSDPTGFKRDYLKVDAQSHMGGSLEFGPDGYLYVTTGDGGSYNIPDRRNLEVLSIDALTGKVLRIDPETGLGAPDNPFVIDGDLGANASKVWQLGFRNPYTMAIDEDGTVIIADTGWGQAEEINIAPPGANFGWPYYEGGDGVLWETPQYSDFPEAGAFYQAVADGDIVVTPAFKGFSRSASDPGYQVQAIVGSDGLHRGDAYPDSLDNHYFFGDVARTNVFAVNLNDPRDVKYLYTTGDVLGPVYFEPGPDGHMYYADLLAGEIGRLAIEEQAVEMALNGSASSDPATGSFRLTGSSGGFYSGTGGSQFQAGSAFSTARIDVRDDFRIDFEAYFGDGDGADGAAFVLHADPAGPAALGDNGGGLGANGIVNGLALEFDTYDGGASVGDIPNDHVALADTDTGDFLPIGAVTDLGDIENGAWHDISIRWNAETQELVAIFDGMEVQRVTVDLADGFLGGSPYAHFGFTAATGGAVNEHRVILSDVAATGEDGGPLGRDPAGIDFGAVLSGSAASEATTNTLVLTTGGEFEAGAAMAPARIDLAQPFEVSFAFQVGDDPEGGDGLGFVLHNDPSGAGAIGMTGGNLGLDGIENGLAVEFDTWDNGTVDQDIPNDHLAVYATGDPDSPFVPAVDLDELEDGTWHRATVRWDPAGDLEVIVDGAVAAAVSGADVREAVGGEGFAHFGFTAATGGAVSTHEVRVTEIAGTMEGEDPVPLAFETVGAASSSSSTPGSFVLTEDAAWQTGGVAATDAIDLTGDFRLEARVFLGEDDAGADGIAFALHDDPRGATALGEAGGNHGAFGVDPMFAVEIDTFDNGAELGDLAADHVAVRASGERADMLAAPVAIDDVEDGAWHDITLRWNAADRALAVEFDGEGILDVGGTAIGGILGDADSAWLLVAASTGGLSNLQMVSDIAFFGNLAPSDDPLV